MLLFNVLCKEDCTIRKTLPNKSPSKSNIQCVTFLKAVLAAPPPQLIVAQAPAPASCLTLANCDEHGCDLEQGINGMKHETKIIT